MTQHHNKPETPTNPPASHIELEPLEYPSDHLPQADSGVAGSSRRGRSNPAAAIAGLLVAAMIIAATILGVLWIGR